MIELIRRVRRSLLIVSLTASVIGISAIPAFGASLKVTKTADTNDGACNSDCSLREAVVAANQDPEPDEIKVPAGTYRLTLGSSLEISSEVSIGSFGGAATVDAMGSDRVLLILDSGDARLTRMRIVGGETPDNGGGILNAGTLTLRRSEVTANRAMNGAGIFNAGTVSILDSSIADNAASERGGGIYLAEGMATITRSALLGNTAGDSGGGIYNAVGLLEIRGSDLKANSSTDGGGLFNASSAELDDSKLSGNGAPLGGGISNSGLVTLTNSKVRGNQAFIGGGMLNTGDANVLRSTVSANTAEGSGGGVFNEGALVVLFSTISGNTSTVDNGGGISNTEGSVEFSNSTLSRNKAAGGGGGLHQNDQPGSVLIRSATIVGNTADTDNNGGDGGGIYVQGSSTVDMMNSILADNVDEGQISHPDCSGSLTSTDFNIIGSTSGCDTTLQPGDTIGSPDYGPLADNGGSTKTHALVPGSVAIDHGPAAAGCGGSDQRMVPRQGSCDTGSYQQVFCGGTLVNVVGTADRDLLEGSSKVDGILAQGSDDVVRAGKGADRVCGGDGNDKLFGTAGSDKLLGGDGDDFLVGGSGSDRCIGGEGSDKRKKC